jgi:hypothetical protein
VKTTIDLSNNAVDRLVAHQLRQISTCKKAGPYGTVTGGSGGGGGRGGREGLVACPRNAKKHKKKKTRAIHVVGEGESGWVEVTTPAMTVTNHAAELVSRLSQGTLSNLSDSAAII